MAPLNALDTWSQRTERAVRQPRAKCFLIGEGANTEYWYLESLAKILAKRGLPEQAELKPVNRTGDERNQSSPRKLAEQAKKIIEDADGLYGFDKRTDRVLVLFDADVYKGKEDEYINDFTALNEVAGVAVTYPSFELFLLLHVQNAFEEHIKPNEAAIVENVRVGKHRRFVDKLASDVLGFNVKSNPAVGQLAADFETAVIAEKQINQDASRAIGRLTSNVGLMLEEIIREGAK